MEVLVHYSHTKPPFAISQPLTDPVCINCVRVEYKSGKREKNTLTDVIGLYSFDKNEYNYEATQSGPELPVITS